MKKLMLIASVSMMFSLTTTTADARVIRVVDGDSLQVSNLRAPVRLKGVDAPEIHKSARSGYKCDAELQLGLQAKAALQEMVNPPHKVVVKRTKDFDEYGRRIAIVTSDGKDVGQLLVARGLAKPWTGSGQKPNWC